MTQSSDRNFPAGTRLSLLGLAVGVLAAVVWLAMPEKVDRTIISTGDGDSASDPNGVLAEGHGVLGELRQDIPWWDASDLSERDKALQLIASAEYKRGRIADAQAVLQKIEGERDRNIAIDAVLRNVGLPQVQQAVTQEDKLARIVDVCEVARSITDPYILAIGYKHLADERLLVDPADKEPTADQLISSALAAAEKIPPVSRPSGLRAVLSWLRGPLITVCLALLGFVATNIGAALLGEVGEGMGRALWALRQGVDPVHRETTA